MPWHYASYPAALPHVLGVSALARDGSVPLFSNRDPLYNDLAAPGEEIFSTLPRELTSHEDHLRVPGLLGLRPARVQRRRKEPRSRRPQVAAAAAALLLIGATVAAAEPGRRPANALGAGRHAGDRLQVAARTAATGSAAGAGSTSPTPSSAAGGRRARGRTRYEPNDDAGHARVAHRVAASGSSPRSTTGTTVSDVYRVKLRQRRAPDGQREGPGGTDTNLVLWKPGVGDRRDLRAAA